MTVVNPKSISGITINTTASGSDDLLTIHTNNGTERLRIDSTGATKIVTGIVTTLTATTGIVTTLTANTVTSLGAVSGTTGTFTGDVDIADTIVHTGDTNTKIRFPAADTITAETGGTERLRINSSGQVMIGTDTPTSNQAAQALTIALQNNGNTGITLRSGTGGGDLNEGSIFFSDATSGAGEYAGYLQYSHASNYFRIGVNSVERVRITSDGYFGIGMTPAAPLHVTGSTADTLRITNGSNTSIYYKIGRNHLDGKLEFRGTQSGDEAYSFGGVSGEKIRFQPAGGISFNGDTAAANALDDYEEGTWTPTCVTGTLSYGHQSYTKIGRMVYVTTYVNNFSDRSSSSAVEITGLPYAPANESDVGACVFYRVDHTDEGQIAVRTSTTSPGKLLFLVSSQGGSESWFHITHSDLNHTNSQIKFSIWYGVA